MYNILENDYIIDNAPYIHGTSLINSSQMPDNMYNCFNRRDLQFIHINAHSMFHKLSEIRLLALKIKPAIISISETWLKEYITNQSVKIENYNVIRRDRESHAGGVCVYIRSDLAYNQRVELQNTDLEDLWIELLLPKTKPILIGTCYRAQDNNKLFTCLESTLSKIQPDAEAHILGDFNICLLKNSNLAKNYKNLLKSFNFTQLINSPTRVTQTSSTLIDHIHTSNTDKICQAGVIETGLSDHYITYCTRKVVRGMINKHNTISTRSMKKYSESSFIEILLNIDWSVVLDCMDVNEAWEKFKVLFTLAMDSIAPMIDTRMKRARHTLETGMKISFGFRPYGKLK